MDVNNPSVAFWLFQFMSMPRIGSTNKHMKQNISEKNELCELKVNVQKWKVDHPL
jgi:hypothetical protein